MERAGDGPFPDEKGETLRDGLPEHHEYRDEGCDVSPSCLECPLPRCRYEVPGGLRQILNEARDAEILWLREREGMPVKDLAVRYGLSRRTVFRILSRAGEGGRRRAGATNGRARGDEAATRRKERC